RRRVAFNAAGDNIDSDAFVERAAGQAIDARKIHEFDRAPRRRFEAAAAALDGDAGIVGDFGASAGQAVEECGLAAIGRADKSQTKLGHQADALGSTSTASASARRSASSVRLSRMASGWPPNGPRVISSTSSPSEKPISRSLAVSSASVSAMRLTQPI